MCCDNCGASVTDPNKQTLGECPHCGDEVVIEEDGSYCSTSICGYSPLQCKHCESRPCDLSC